MNSNNKAQSNNTDPVEDLGAGAPGEAYRGEQGAELAFHPCSAIFSLLDGAERDALEESIQKNGIREPIVLLEGKILDGRNRYRAARALKLSSAKIPIRQFEPERDGNPF